MKAPATTHCIAASFRQRVLLESPTSQKSVNNVTDARTIKTSFDPITFRFNNQIGSLVRGGRLLDARKLFDEMPQRNIISKNTILWGYVGSGDLQAARELFDSMAERTVVTWTIMMEGYSQNRRWREAVSLFVGMLCSGTPPDYVTFAALVCACRESKSMDNLTQVHGQIFKFGYHSTVIVRNSLIDCYCKLSRLDLGRRLFEGFPLKDSVSFNAMITGYSSHGLNSEAVVLFMEMLQLGLKPSDFTFAATISASLGLDDMVVGGQVHSLVVKTNFFQNVFVANSLLDFYSKQNSMADTENIFTEMEEPDGVSYNILITSYVWKGLHREAIVLLKELQFEGFQRSNFPFPTLLSLATLNNHLEMGKQIHGQIVVADVDSEDSVGNSLVDMYCKCGRFSEAEKIFAGNLDRKSSVPWTAIMSGYTQKGYYEECLKMFIRMCEHSVTPDQATFATILRASSNLASPSLGRQIHSVIVRSGFMSNVFSGSGMVDCYGKSGFLRDAVEVFDEIPFKNAVSWNAMISVYAHNGDGESTQASFAAMVESGHLPDSVTFLSLLSSCSHCGKIEEGLLHFESMIGVYRIEPKREHYASMVDMLCRGGRFKEAERMISRMPFDPDEVMWSSVLNSCRIHKNHALAAIAAGRLFDMELRDGGAYVNMSNMFASAGRWDRVGAVKKAMRSRGVKKVPAYSWVEIKGVVHVFSASDKSHPRTAEIEEKIEVLMEEMVREGYSPDTSCALHHVDEQTKVETLKYHSERLAIAFALIAMPEGLGLQPLLVMKNIRACTDCHAAIKVISKVIRREIVVRDSSRFHHFRDGFCSCRDYW